MNAYKILKNSILLSGLLLASVTMGWGNNITVSQNVSLERPVGQNYWLVKFDVTWQNAWNNATSRDAAWIFLKFRKSGTATWHHAYLGTNVGDHSRGSCGSNCGLELGPRNPSQTPHASNNPVLGIFLHPGPISGMATFTSNTVSLRWDYGNSPLPLGANDPVEVRAYAIEMVRVVEGRFPLGTSDSLASNRFTSTVGDSVSVRSSASTVVKPMRRSDNFSACNSCSSRTIDVQVPDCSNSLVIAGITFRDKDITSVTLANSAMTQLAIGKNGKSDAAIYYALNPGAGSKTVSINLSGNANSLVLHTAVYCDVNQGNPFGTPTQANGNTKGSKSLTTSTTPGDRVYGLANIKTGPFSQISGELINLGIGTDMASAANQIMATGTSTSVSWSFNTDGDFIVHAVPIKPAANLDPLISPGITVNGPSGITYGNASSAFPTGFKGFYCMKYELTQGQYASFLNTLTVAQQQERIRVGFDPVYGQIGEPALVTGLGDTRNYIKLINTFPPHPGRFSSDRKFIPCNFLLWDDLAAWLDWAGLRPMTELEFEKACRGSATTALNYPWGNTTLPSAFSGMNQIIGFDSENEGPSTSSNFNTQFDQNVQGRVQGPFRVGGFARSSGNIKRKHAGATTLGVCELAGNLVEMVVSMEDATGRQFSGEHGDGNLGTYPTAWPSYPAGSTKEFFGVIGRGGSWMTTSMNELKVSDRSQAGVMPPAARNSAGAYGGRGVRSVN